jgi:hypothetical protein
LRPIEAEPVAEVDGEHVHGADRRLEETFDERVAPLDLGWGCQHYSVESICAFCSRPE